MYILRLFTGDIDHARREWTIVETFSSFKFGYFWPTPTYKMGFEVE
jgi:hypothetical protein